MVQIPSKEGATQVAYMITGITGYHKEIQWQGENKIINPQGNLLQRNT